jgi:hypothetical protein
MFGAGIAGKLVQKMPLMTPQASPFCLWTAFLLRKGRSLFCQKVIFDQARALHEAIIRECIVEEETGDARDADE